MKHLIAMLFYNIVIGSTVMFKEDYEKVKYQRFAESILQKHIWTHRKYKVTGIYTTFFKSKKQYHWQPNNFFKIMIAIENTTGYIQYVGINAVKELTI